MKSQLLSIGLMILTALAVKGQNQPSGSVLVSKISVELGGMHYQVRDEILAPLRYQGVGPAAGLTYSLEGSAGLHQAQFRFSYGFLTNRYDHNCEPSEIYLAYRYLHRVARNGNNSRLHVGGFFNWSGNMYDYPTWDNSHRYWLNLYEIGAAIQWTQPVADKHIFTAGLQIPFLAFSSRPPEFWLKDQEDPGDLLGSMHQDMEVTSLPGHMVLMSQIEYLFKASPKISIGGSYLFNYRYHDQPECITVIAQTVLLRIQYKFGNKSL